MTALVTNLDKTSKVAPFLKWAGGKRWLANKVLGFAPTIHGRYIEPFLGGGAVFFTLEPSKSLLSDSNADLINTYSSVRSDYKHVASLLVEHQAKHSKEYYYEVRDFNPKCEYQRAAQFIYLNRTCWNGLYRVNLKGEFNVPIGTKSSVVMPSDNWEYVAKLLRQAEIRCSDFEAIIDESIDGDVIFADPPYTVKHNYNGFIKYNEALFSWADQIRLRDALLRAKNRGSIILATNANHDSVRELYENNFSYVPLQRQSVLAASPSFRGQYEELFIFSEST